jgi:hypothetical protein
MVKGWSNYRIAREYNICEATIRYHIQRGALKRKVDADETTGSLPAKRSEAYLAGADGMGMAVTRVDERVACAFGLNPIRTPYFENCQSVPLGAFS